MSSGNERSYYEGALAPQKQLGNLLEWGFADFVKRGGFCSGLPVCLLFIARWAASELGLHSGMRAGASLYFLSASEPASDRDSDSRGQCGQGACQLPALHSYTLVVGRVIPFEGVHWNRRSFSKERGTGRRLTALTKEHLHSPWGIASTAQRSLFSIHCRESVDPSLASHKCLHL